MNKFKKIASVVIATTMAGTMVASLAACTDRGATDDPKKDYTPLTVAIGYNNVKTGITYNPDNEKDSKGESFGGRKATSGTLKAAWEGLSNKLKIRFNDVYDGSSAGKNISAIKNGAYKLGGVGIFTASTAAAIEESASGALLDINTVLDKLPNYKAFLEENEVVWASLITNATSGSMYYLPYFDGNNDIERYVLLRKDVVESLLNGTEATGDTTTYAAQATAKGGKTAVIGTTASVESYMGKVAADNYDIAVTDPASLTGTQAYGNDKDEVKDNKTVTITVSYGKVIEALGDTNSALYKAVDAAKTALNISDAIPTTSGNIVDIQNYLINGSQGKVTGSQLVEVLKAYIDTAYLKGGEPFYVTGNGLTRASVFNSACAAWDVDLYVALGRCYVTNAVKLGVKATANAENATLNNYLLGGRASTSQRMTDMYALAGELYGVRGLESRYNYNYIDKDGQLQDARADAASWDAVNLINKMVKEGLVYNGEGISGKGQVSSPVGGTAGEPVLLSIHDYVQTQTLYGFSAKENEGYNFAPVLTPVSKWNDGTGTKYMRFTESWRGVKDGGLCVSKAYYDNGTEAQKKAILEFIDYCYSKDGQILMTYGTQASSKTATDGLWYGNPVTDAVEGVTLTKGEDGAYTADTLSALVTKKVIATNDNGKTYYVTKDYQSKYFMYDNILYSGTYYNGRMIPTMTDANLKTFHSVGGNSFTNYARYYLGTTLPCFEKDQGFEYQCTSECGQVGSNIVALALKNGTIKHQYQTLNGTDDEGNYVGGGSATNPNYWYTLATTYLPYETTEINSHGTTYLFLTGVGIDKNYDAFGFNNSGDTDLNLYDYVMFYGYGGSVKIHTEKYPSSSGFESMPANATAIINTLKDKNYLEDFITMKQGAWSRLKTWYSNKNTNA